MEKKKNAMDNIIIRYGQPQRKPSERSRAILIKMLEEHITQEEAEKRLRPKEVSLPEFLKIKSRLLSPDELKIQIALRAIYSLNNGYPPIYRHFPKREKPLVIDTTHQYPNKNTLGSYNPDTNEIQLAKITELAFGRLIEVFAHELKHAQQYITTKKDFNNYQQHQLRFLEEAQANACEDRVLLSLCPEHPRAKDFMNTLSLFLIFGPGNKKNMTGRNLLTDSNLKNAEELVTLDYLHKFLTDKKFQNWYIHYKDTYDRVFPILKTDTPLTEIPPEFDITFPKRVLEKLKLNVPKRARTPFNRVIQAMTNDDTRALTILLKGKDKDGKPLIANESILSIGLQALFTSEAKNTTNLLETVLKSGRCSTHDIEELLDSTFHLSNGEKLSEGLLKTKIKLLDILLEYKTSKGRKVLTAAKLDNAIANAKFGADIDGNDEYRKLIKHLKAHIDTTKNRMKKRLKKSQIPSIKKHPRPNALEM